MQAISRWFWGTVSIIALTGALLSQTSPAPKTPVQKKKTVAKASQNDEVEQLKELVRAQQQ